MSVPPQDTGDDVLPPSSDGESSSGYCSIRHPDYGAGQRIPLGMPIDLDALSNLPNVPSWLIVAYRMGNFIPYGCRVKPPHYNNPDVECSSTTKRPHKGIDIGSGKPFYRAPIFATADGVVAKAQQTNRSEGRYIKINHGNGFETLYMHLDEILVTEGQSVQAGCIIGYMGHSGGNADQTKPRMGIDMTHLHYEIRYSSGETVVATPDGGTVSIVRKDSECPNGCETVKRKFWPAIKPNDFMTYYER